MLEKVNVAGKQVEKADELLRESVCVCAYLLHVWKLMGELLNITFINSH